MEPESFFHVAIKVEDVATAAAFFEDAFDGELIEYVTPGSGNTRVEHASLHVADMRVYCFDRAPYEADGLVEPLPTGFLHFGYVVDDLEAAYEELTDAGIEFFMEPSVFGSLEISFFEGPAGVRIELLEHLD